MPRPAYLVEYAYLRAIATIAAIVIHAVAPAIVAGSAGHLLVPYLAIDAAAHVAVPLFVFVSGAVLMHVHPPPVGAGRFIVRRLARLLPPYLAVSVVYLALIAAGQGGMTVNEGAVRLLTATASYHLWFVALAVMLAFLYPVVAPWVRFARPRTLARAGGLLAVLSSAYFLLKALLHIVEPGWVVSALLVQGLAPAGYLIFFVAGMALTAHPDQSARLAARLTPGLAALGVLAAVTLGAARLAAWLAPSPALLALAGLSFLVEPAAYLLATALLLAGVRALGPGEVTRARAVLVALGRASYGIYLVQGGMVLFVLEYLARLGLGPASPAFLPAAVLTTLVLSWGVVAIAAGAVRVLKDRGWRRDRLVVSRARTLMGPAGYAGGPSPEPVPAIDGDPAEERRRFSHQSHQKRG